MEERLKEVFGPSDINPNSYEPSLNDIIGSYLRYLLNEYNKGERKEKYDWGTIIFKNKSYFLWGTNPLINLSGSPYKAEDLFSLLSQQFDIDTLLTGLEFGFKRNKISKEDYSRDIKKQKENLNKGRLDIDSAKGPILDIIKKNPLCLGFNCYLELRNEEEENPEKSFRRMLFDWIYYNLNRRGIKILWGKIEPLPHFKNKIKNVKNQDTLLLLEKDSKKKLMSIEIKFGRHNNFINQIIKSHIIIKNITGGELYSILFSPYNHFKENNISDEILKEMYNEKNILSGLPIPFFYCLDFRNCFFDCCGDFDIKETYTNKNLKNFSQSRGIISCHLDNLLKLIELRFKD